MIISDDVDAAVILVVSDSCLVLASVHILCENL